jgi:hypothetical protein
VLLDNQADISIMHPGMLLELRMLKSSVRVNGIGIVQMEVRQVGSQWIILSNLFDRNKDARFLYSFSTMQKANSDCQLSGKYPIFCFRKFS